MNINNILWKILNIFFILSSSIIEVKYILINGQKGIVIAMGPKESHFIGTYAIIRSIRKHSSLPIEIWCYSFEYDDIPLKAKNAILENVNLSINILESPIIQSNLNFKSKSLKNILKGKSWITDYFHFSAKPIALISTNLTEVLLLDSDAVVFPSPQELFELEEYKKTGTLFLYDRFLVINFNHLLTTPKHYLIKHN